MSTSSVTIMRLQHSYKGSCYEKKQDQGISEQTERLIENLLAGKFSLSEIAKVTGISEQCLLSYIYSL